MFAGGVAPWVLDPDYAEPLWDVSLELVAHPVSDAHHV